MGSIAGWERRRRAIAMDLKRVDKGRELYVILRYQFRDLDQTFHSSCLTEFENICMLYDNIPCEPRFKVRWAKYFRGQYYMKHGDNIRAEKAFIEALGANAPEETIQELPDARIKCNLLILYHSGNNLELEIPLLNELIRLNNNDKYNHVLNQEELFKIYTISNEFFNQTWGTGYLDQLKNVLLDIKRDLKQNKQDLEKYYESMPEFVFTSVLVLIESGYASQHDYKIYRKIIKRICKKFPLNVNTRVLMLRTLMRIACETDLSEGDYVEKCAKLAESSSVPVVSKAEIFQAVASFYCGSGQYDIGTEYLHRSMDMITREWHFHVKHFEKRTYQNLVPMQYNFVGCYDMMHRYMDIGPAYEKVLQFKALASLAGRERNRILFSGGMNKDLIKAIQDIQDKIAYSETEKIFRSGMAEYEDHKIESRRLEAEFAAKFPQDVSFMDISLEKVQEAIPDDSAVIEYVVYERDYEKHEFMPSSSKAEPEIDIYVIRKEKGDCTLRRRDVQEGRRVLEESRQFVCVLSRQESVSGERKETLRRDLYRKLVKPILPYISGIKQLYIAPDRDLINLPFEILNDEENVSLEKDHNIIKIECARDFLFGSAGSNVYGEGSLIIGNPQFAVNGDGFYCGNEPAIFPIPFSGVEAEIVSRYCGCGYYSGKRAMKALLLSASGYRNIHIATHGYFDSSGKSESVYSSCLIFAGAENWTRSGKADRIYQNGIVTADEISRMDLRSVELAVLSSCWGGMNEIMADKGFHGMIGAFLQAGVHYVISNLWSADEISTTILMEHFYLQYAKRHQTPSAALNLAKQYLRRVTIGELRKKGWFKFILHSDIDEVSKDAVREYEEYNDWECPFEDEEYWGGFSCYRCN